MAPATVTDYLSVPATAPRRVFFPAAATGHTRRPVARDRDASADVRGASFRASWRIESQLETTAGGW